MRRLALAALIVLSAACRKVPQVGKAAPGDGAVAFDEKGGAFSCRVPADWKALEDRQTGGPLVMFFGPGADGRAVSISVGRFPDGVDRIKTPEDYLESMKRTGDAALDVSTRTVNGRVVWTFHAEVPHGAPIRRKPSAPPAAMDRQDVVLIPSADGFFELTHSAPAASYRATLPVFDALVQSFQPKG